MNYLFQVMETDTQNAVSIRSNTTEQELPALVGQVFNKLMEYISKKDSLAIGPAFVAYYNMDDNNIEVEIGFPVGEHLEDDGEIKGSTIPCGKRVVGYYKGAYEYMSYFHEEMFKWILLNDLEPSGVIFEYYFNSPGNIPNEELLTKIEFLLK
ncbi:MAG: GyrI-like domain-containing protein [Firmicutes bacterium]|nr:GyrI-like domain-containing protein [Bacillota bacterium]